MKKERGEKKKPSLSMQRMEGEGWVYADWSAMQGTRGTELRGKETFIPLSDDEALEDDRR